MGAWLNPQGGKKYASKINIWKNQHLEKSGKENSLKDVKKTFAGTVTTVGLQPLLGVNFTGQGQQEGGQPF